MPNKYPLDILLIVMAELFVSHYHNDGDDCGDILSAVFPGPL